MLRPYRGRLPVVDPTAYVDASALAMGTPAKVRRPLSDAEVASILDYAGNYVRYRLDYMTREETE